MLSRLRATLGTRVDLRPVQSQVVLVGLLVIAAIALLGALVFLWSKPVLAIIPFALSIVLLAVVIIGWAVSRRDIDLHGGPSTEIADAHGNQITTDTRTLSSPEAVQNIERLFSGLAHREPLPEPDGLVDDDGNPVPGSHADAAARVQAANQAGQRIANTLASKSQTETSLQQQYPLPSDEPPSNGFPDNNAPENRE